MTETRCGEIGLGEFDVDKVPPPRRLIADLGHVAVAVPILVCPRRFAGDVVRGQGVGVGSEQRRHLGADSRV